MTMIHETFFLLFLEKLETKSIILAGMSLPATLSSHEN